jgi:hypothetical protein
VEAGSAGAEDVEGGESEDEAEASGEIGAGVAVAEMGAGAADPIEGDRAERGAAARWGEEGAGSEAFIAASLSLTESPTEGWGESAAGVAVGAAAAAEVVEGEVTEAVAGVEFVFVIEGRRETSGEGAVAVDEALILASLSLTDNPVAGSGLEFVESVAAAAVAADEPELSVVTDGRRAIPATGAVATSPLSPFFENAAMRSLTDDMAKIKCRHTPSTMMFCRRGLVDSALCLNCGALEEEAEQ